LVLPVALAESTPQLAAFSLEGLPRTLAGAARRQLEAEGEKRWAAGVVDLPSQAQWHGW
jgi:hypothetical protein